MLIVLVDDVAANNEFLARALAGYETRSYTDPRQALDFCTTADFDLIIADQKMPHLNGIELISKIRAQRNSFIALIVSAYTDTDDLVDAVNSNIIFRYVVKPFTPEAIVEHVQAAMDCLALRREKEDSEASLRQSNASLREENRRLRGERRPVLDEIVGLHPSMIRLKERARLYASGVKPVLITGETGTGKELLARALHELSDRSEGPFIVVNSATLPDSLIESELFGFRRGAFTGAMEHKPGLFSVAEGGTLFLDEIGELPLPAQAKLLRVLQFGTFYPVGGVAEVSVSVRLVSASNKDLREACSRGEFRKDLYYRIAGLELSIPPLRERAEDIPLIFDAVASARPLVLPQLAAEAKEMLLQHAFPGNVRELENLVEKLHLHCRAHGQKIVTAELLAEMLTERGPARGPAGERAAVGRHFGSLHGELSSREREIIVAVLADTKGNISRAARALGLSRQGLRNKIARHGLEKDV
jgi:two-component system, NtrC family, response regulator HupR/HoxA